MEEFFLQCNFPTQLPLICQTGLSQLLFIIMPHQLNVVVVVISMVLSWA